MAEPLGGHDAQARRERRGQGRDGRRLAVRLPRPPVEVPDHHVARAPWTTIADGRRTPPNPVDPRTINDGESVQLTEDWYAGVNAKGELPRAPGRDGLRHGHARLQRRQADQPDDGARLRRRRGLRAPGAQARRRLKALNLALGNTKDLSDGKLQVGRHRHLQPGRLGRLPGSSSTRATCRRTARRARPTRRTRRRSTTPTRRRSEAKLGGIKLGGQVNSLRRPRDRPRTTPDGTIDNIATARIRRHRHRRHRARRTRNGNDRHRADPLAAAARRRPVAGRRALPAQRARSRRPTSGTTCGSTSPSRSCRSCAEPRAHLAGRPDRDERQAADAAGGAGLAAGQPRHSGRLRRRRSTRSTAS